MGKYHFNYRRFCIGSVLIILLAIYFLYQQERELQALRAESDRLFQERIELMQKHNEALMRAKHPEYFQTKSE